MLQQILNDMYVDPELLAELDEEQKQILFCKMREEQVRKWKMREKENKEEDFTRKKKEGGKKVSFLMGGDGEPLVVVLGGDEDVDVILQERAKRQAEMEGEALRKAAEEELDKLVRLSQSTVRAMERKASHGPPVQPSAPKPNDPRREAVVRSLQEATKEMEEEMRALELHEKDQGTKHSSTIPISTSSHVFFDSSKPYKDNLNSSRRPNFSSLSRSTFSNNSSTTNKRETGRVSTLTKPQISVSPYVPQSSPVIPFGVAAQIEQFERLSESSLEALKTATLERAKHRRQKEILDNLRSQVEAAKSQANQTSESIYVAAEKEDVAWMEQERKAKEAERRIREIARRAREEHRRTSSSTSDNSFNGSSVGYPQSPIDPFLNGDINGNIKPIFSNSNGNLNASNDNRNQNNNCHVSQSRSRVRPFRPPNREAVIDWFKEEELPKGICFNTRNNEIQPWFHGVISRAEAERILDRAEIGSFLVRVSERIWGYAVSYKAPDRCRHYLIDAIGGRYAFLGSHQNTHSSLGLLVEFHKKEFITASGKEILNKPCGQADLNRPDYAELLSGTNYSYLINC